ncbi:MAG: M48 family metallopeptidase [Acidimicrobiales bacterium]
MPTHAAAAGSGATGAATRGAVDARIRSNRRRRRMLLAAAGGVPGAVVGAVVGSLADPVVGAVVAVVVAVVVGIGLEHRATAFVLRVIGGHRIDASTAPRLANLVDGLCATCGVRPPALWLVPEPVPNACAVGRGPGHGVLVITSGLMDSLDIMEQEGVVAHELMHLKDHDAAVSELAVTVLAPLVWVTGRDRMVHRAVGKGREYRADQDAAAAVRSPRGLQHALQVMAGGAEPASTSVFAGHRWALTRWLWIDPMVGARGEPVVGALDATQVRSAALAEW